MGLSRPYLASMLANTSGGRARSLVKGLPGAKRIMKKETVIKTSRVGIASSRRLRMNFNIDISCPVLLPKLESNVISIINDLKEAGLEGWSDKSNHLMGFIRHIVLEDKKIQLWNTSLSDLKRNFGWKEIYSVGNPKIDAEHKKLFDIAEEAFTEVDATQKSVKIKEVLTSLYDYMKTHFKHEEKFMQEINYPSLEEHKELHHIIIEKINTFVKKLPTMDENIFEKELAKIIDIALVHHIILEDKKIVDWINSNSVIK